MGLEQVFLKIITRCPVFVVIMSRPYDLRSFVVSPLLQVSDICTLKMVFSVESLDVYSLVSEIDLRILQIISGKVSDINVFIILSLYYTFNVLIGPQKHTHIHSQPVTFKTSLSQ